ncbi:MAG: hypothetical protein CL912_15155 [Deltaproteobacteria bacterium]|nr:hypothetical protein [Deltaproteobacteria bacterium]
MAWAANRQTEKVEDKAYCLLGIFGVKLPMIYEEKDKAFRRLQLEILKQRDDHTLFAWRVPQMRTGQPDLGTGLLAESPEAFANSTSVVQADHHANISHYSMNNKGIHIRLPLVPLEKLAELYTTSERAFTNCGGGQTCVVMLECRNGSARIGLYLRRARGYNTWIE